MAVQQERALLCGELLEVVATVTRGFVVGAVGPEISLEMLGGVDCVAGDQDVAAVGERDEEGLRPRTFSSSSVWIR